MNISRIRQRADELLMNCRPRVVRIFVFMMLVNVARGLIPSGYGLFSNVVSMAVLIIFIAFEHGYVVSSLKVVRNNCDSLDDSDAFVGFTRFKELFFTYFCMFGILFIAIFLLVFVLIFIIVLILPAVVQIPFSIDFMETQGDLWFTQLSYLLANFAFNPGLVLMIVLISLVFAGVVYIVSLYLFAVPYLLEQYKMTGMKAVSESFSFMRGHGWAYFKLSLSFVGWMILSLCIGTVVSFVLSFSSLLATLFGSLASGLFAAYTYLPRFIVSQAVFFEEIAYYRYRMNNNQEFGTGEDGQNETHVESEF